MRSSDATFVVETGSEEEEKKLEDIWAILREGKFKTVDRKTSYKKKPNPTKLRKRPYQNFPVR